MILIGLFTLTIVTLVAITIIGLALYKKGTKVWREKKFELTFLEKIAFNVFYTFEDIMEPKRQLKDNPIRYLLEVYDYLATREVDLETVNIHLKSNAYKVLGKKDAVFYIKDYWNSPFGRLFTIVLEEGPNTMEHETIYPLEFLTRKINLIEGNKSKRILTVVK